MSPAGELPAAELPPSLQAWWLLNRLAAYCLVNLLDDPALLAMAFC